ncbi:MAG: DsrH/TusB family sulfur relay protein [Actinobacteria bacterium]|nr:DsrH/TusB family sulfur relay protein [Actinomycetota bacterium]
MKRVLSVVRGADAGAARETDPTLDLNAYALAEELELTIVLAGRGVELALDDPRVARVTVAGVEVPAATPGSDVRALLASGVQVFALAEDVAVRGLSTSDLVSGVELIPGDRFADLLTGHDVTLTSATT